MLSYECVIFSDLQIWRQCRKDAGEIIFLVCKNKIWKTDFNIFPKTFYVNEFNHLNFNTWTNSNFISNYFFLNWVSDQPSLFEELDGKNILIFIFLMINVVFIS